MSLRVLQIVPSISLVYGGPSQMVRGFSQALAQAGSEVTVLTTDSNGDSGQAPLDVPLNQPVEQDGYRVRYFRCSPFRRYKFSVDLLRWLSQNAQNYDIAHIHALFSPISTAAATVARQKNLPYILRPLGTLDPADLAKKKRLKQLYGQLLERPNLAGAAAIHFTSPLEAEVSHRFGVATTDWVIPLGVDPQPSLSRAEQDQVLDALQVPRDRPIVLFLSRLDPKKGLDLLIPALAQVAQADRPFHLVLAGDNPQDPAYKQAIEQQIQTLGLAKRTTMTGFVRGAQKQALLQAAALFVLPSYYENFGIAVAEAMLAGLPVVISNGVYIWPDIVAGEAGWVCDLSVDGIAGALQESLQSPDQRKLRGQQAQRYAQTHYRWDAIAKQTLAAYDQVLPRRGDGSR
ncbi:hormogonium polysaccharide biosynthesis glycosyltransferase HpsP [Phormidium sp. FACHB-1136]|uniref:hormogonium polysaccharide biosynthesis glycosyltransferase HpsP n=1 Tax=Phormidium sp. FACHB-1136 TaxID=2692848 RepID=UPI00168A3C2B|nr:hormogonium polysaccharide biosynthesis glycosyltransferase HpsP [Phormidium sp. FACHB-1136]MBD2426117.1 glycosyltransferase [Phormidium sp. FACHB-1136]